MIAAAIDWNRITATPPANVWCDDRRTAAPVVAPTTAPATAASPWVDPKAVWPDDRGDHVQAHGGGVLRVGDTFWWFGEDRGRANLREHRYVGCYSSTDLTHWTRHKPVVDTTNPDGTPGPWVLERPKVFHNPRTGKFVLYAHYDDRSYHLARVGVFVCDTVDGDYKFVRSFRPLDKESRDIGQFVDDDGAAYLIFESRPTQGFFIAKLSDDYLSVAKETCFVEARLEGGAVVRYNGLYYCIGSAMTGWAANPNQYATAEHLEGPWSAFADVAPPATKTYASQSAFLLKIVGDRQTTVVFVGDEWRPKAQWDSRYLWMPLQIGGGKLLLPSPRPWAIDVKTGVVTFK